MKKYLLIIFILYSFQLKAQDFKEWTISQAEMEMKSYSKDTSANAVVLNEFGDARITDDDQENIQFKYHTKIKIFKSKGFSNGDILIPIYYGDNNTFETVKDIEAITFYKDNNGMIQKQSFDASKVFKEKKNKHWTYIKFAMPNLQEGCVIEYKYTLRSPYHHTLRKWDFQSELPKVYSEYLVHIPAVYEYNVSLTGPLKLSKNEALLEKDCYSPGGGFKADCSKITYRMENIPAFVIEENMTAPENFLSAINFELSLITDSRGLKHKITQDWKDVDALLKKYEYFGSQIKKKDLFKDQVVTLLADKTDGLSKAKAVYEYIKAWFKWNNQEEKYSESIKKAYESHTGSSGDINLSLAAALNAAGLNPETVILSTRNNGFVNKLYPTLSNFDYVVVKLDIEGKTYLLDATEPLLPFGLLPLRCINDQGRVISFTKPSYWIDMVASQKRTKHYIADLTLQDNGKFKGTITKFSMGYEALGQRKIIKNFNSLEEFVENLDEKLPKIKILKSEISNLDSLEKPLGEVYTIEMDAFDNLNKEKFYFNPFFMDRIPENPFKLNERSYPVDLGAVEDSRIIINITLPDKFSVINQPVNLSLALPDGGGRFISNTLEEGNKFTFSEIKQLSKAIYTSEEYPALKELYNKIIQLQKTDIIFQKAK
ncbi:MAG: hypothetical protein JWN56_2090 [Sphingobacteriales bacterium]|nr:hypothetical protein [Sphingobacteriales bacterium]